MNCCDDYGNCNQGRDCPVRKAQQKPDQSTEFSRKWVARVAITFICVILFLMVIKELGVR